MGVWVWQVPGPCTVGNMRHSTPDPDTTWPFVEKVPDKFHACMQVPCYACVPRCFFLEVCGLQCSLVLLILAAMAHQKREREAKEIGRDLGVYQWSLGCHAHFEFLFFAWYCQMTSDIVSSVNYPNTTREAIRSIRMIRDLTQSTTSHHWRFAYWN